MTLLVSSFLVFELRVPQGAIFSKHFLHLLRDFLKL